MKEEFKEPTRDELLRQNARLRGDLLTIAHRISHDLRTPLGGIITSGEILKEILTENNSPAAPLVSPILDSAEDMAKLIERVSFVLKATAAPVPKRRMKMAEAVFAAQQRLESRILKSGASISEPASWPEVDGVCSWLEMVWKNLFANILQPGKLPLRIELGWREESGKFRFWICDDGVRTPEKHHTCFQPFQGLHEFGNVAGLDLSIVQRLVELQGGNCGHENLPTGGSRWFFTLPADPAADASGSSPAAQKNHNEKHPVRVK
jgi:signal transduction histidine kinase